MAEKHLVPVHVAVIMDGNGRWALQRRLPRFAGHRRGAERVKEIVEAALDAGVKVLTLFAFSTENWSRPQKEINALMRYLNEFLEREKLGMMKKGIRLRAIGRRTKLPPRVLEKIVSVEKMTGANSRFTLVLAIDYGSRQEIIAAVRNACWRALRSGSCEEVDEKIFSSLLYTDGLPDPDFLIRTSGEQRLSNFLLWQCSYTEFYFTEKLWPDFSAEEFNAALAEYAKRRRRFGGVRPG